MTTNMLDYFNIFKLLQPLFSVIILIILMLIMVSLYRKVKIWLVIFIMFILSLLIGINSLLLDYIPFNPYLSIGFILFQFTFFILISIKLYKRYKR